MARTIDPREYTVKRNEILDVALRLVYTKGYEQMTIQDILDALHISKGAFYHYFSSKQDLLEALVERMVDEVEPLITAVVQDPGLSALEKLQRYFDAALRWKTDRKALMLALLRVWYADENAILRQKMAAISAKRMEPLITQIVYQGIQEGIFTTRYPDQVWGVSLDLFQGLGRAYAELLLESERDVRALQRAEWVVAAYTDALERVLGAPGGSLRLLDDETLKEWFVLPVDDSIEKEYPV